MDEAKYRAALGENIRRIRKKKNYMLDEMKY